MKLRLFSIVYRDQFREWFEKRCVASLNWPLNLAELRRHEVQWDIYSTEEERDRVEHIVRPLGFKVEFHSTHIGVAQLEILKNALVTHIRQCIETDSAMFLAPPDTVFGDGSVRAIVKAAEQGRELSISVPHVRVNAETFPVLAEPTSNAKLVTLAWQHLHTSWAGSDGDAPENNSRTSGVSWRKLYPGLIAVTMRIPTIYLARFRQADLEFFTDGQYGCWDHRWPAKLMEHQRHRIIASSDAAFMVEMTPAASNIPPLEKRNDSEVDAYWGDMPHQRANRNAVCVFREGN